MPGDDLVPDEFREVSLEARLLLATARSRLTPAHRQSVRRFLEANTAELDWGRFIDLASRHFVLPLVARNLIRLRLIHADGDRPLAPYRWIFTYVYEGNRRRNLALTDEYAKVLRALTDAGVRYAVRKGPVLTERVYHDLGARRVGDLDLLLARTTVPAFESVVSELGYDQGRPTGNGERIVPFDRKTELFWRVNLSNVTLPYLKPAYRDDVEVYVLDACVDLLPARSLARIDVTEVLERAVPAVLYGEPSVMLDPLDQLVDMCIQLHVEATTLYYIEIGKDLTLMKFVDLLEVIRGVPEQVLDQLPGRVGDSGCADSVYYALHHLTKLYPGAAPARLVGAFEPADTGFLDEYGGFDGDRKRWDRSFADRLFDRERWRTARSEVPGPRAWV